MKKNIDKRRGLNKAHRKRKKAERLRNKKLIKKYCWLIPRSVWSGKKIEDYKYDYTEYDCLGEGWQKAFGKLLLEDIDQELRKYNYRDKYRILQVKEKYGSLRWYDNGGANEATTKYEYISENVCYFCGRPDTAMTNLGWILPVCPKCYEKKWRRDSKFEYEEVISDENPRISDSYSITRFSQDGNETIEYSIKDTADKIRYWWNKNHPDDQVELQGD